MTRPSVYEAAGGAEAFLRLAAAHHQRCLEHPVLEHPFSKGVDPDHIRRLAGYWGEVLGGPPAYTGTVTDQSGMLTIHAGNGMDDAMATGFVSCFAAAVDDADLPEDPELRACLRAYMEWAVADVLTYNPPGSTVPRDLATPRWSWNGLEQEGTDD